MASPSLQFLLFSSIFLITTSSFADIPISQNAIILPITKDPSTLQYVTHIYMGTPVAPIKLVVDLSGSFLWVDCSSGHVSQTHNTIPSGSLHCSRAKGTNGCGNGKGGCSLNIFHTVTRVAARGELAEDIVAVDRVDRSDRIGSITTVDHFLFSCAPLLLLNGLASGAKGMLGLGRSRISLPSQISTKFNSHRRFAACLASSDGVVLSGDWVPPPDVSISLMYTPLISNQDGTLEDYYINVKSIKINGKRLSLNTSKLSLDQKGHGGTKLSTIVPYTTMESTLYEAFTKGYIMAAAAMNMTRVPSVSPFGVCFSSGGVEKTPVGPAVPAVDLVLQSEVVRWRIHGRNSMVEVGDGVTCLGFLDGGLSPRASIVIGGYQLEDNFLEFDLGASMLGFSSSLLLRGSSCSDFKLYSMPSESF